MGMTNIIFTNGCFDIIHSGHIELLKKCYEFGGYVIVGLNSDSSVRRIKGSNRPINNQEDRKKVLNAIRYVAEVIIFDEDTPIKLIEDIRPDILVKGGDYIEDGIVGSEFVKSYGGRVEIVDLVQGKSTTRIIEKNPECRPRCRTQTHMVNDSFCHDCKKKMEQ